MATRTKPRPAAPVVGRVPMARAVELTGLSADTLRRHISTGVLTNARPVADRGHGKPTLFELDEIAVLNAEGEAACRCHRRAMGRA